MKGGPFLSFRFFFVFSVYETLIFFKIFFLYLPLFTLSLSYSLFYLYLFIFRICAMCINKCKYAFILWDCKSFAFHLFH